ncbi:MAG: InlB B-repeat-containing protein [Treponema sp.]|uniref:InlB B-repeat-containing protein n=1 Tax=Treponema sp. TaxID=166 RepID=UPI0025F48411|nr:InlB B-repeat-containing protein [Treponema sp.]MBQ9282507.1 InlB B-repeat-containing protein [Treponema sp.]
MQRISKVFTLMGAILALAFCLASCKANIDDEPTMYTVTVSSSIEHGKVSVDKASAEAGATVKLTATADSGYELDSYSVKDASANELTVTDGTFTMPKSNVTVSATFKETAETVNQKAAAAVIAKITAIGTVAYTDESKAKIDEARTAYDALTEAQKALVPAETLALLTAAETTYAELKAAADSGTANQNAADAVIAKITAIGTVAYTDESKAKIDDARAAYDALTEAQKALVPAETLNLLTAAESTYAELKAAAEQQSAAPETATYTVKHLQQNIADDNYTLKESETKTGTVGQPTAASAKSYEGFTAQSVTQATIAASGTVVEIKYDRKSYTVTFNANGGSTVTSQSVRYGATATKPADPTKTATTTTKYTFADWYSDSGLTTLFSFDTAIKEDITLYAKWTETAVTPQKTAGSISYATTSVSKTTNDAAFTNELTIEGDGTVSYASDNTTVATVDSDGLVTIVGAAGTATITATVTDSASYTYATKTASYTLTVTVAVSSVIINNAPTEALFVNSTGTLTATVSPDNATDKTIVWSSSDPDYVSINSETGEYTIMGTKGYGSATITATAGDKTTTCTITGKVHHTSLQAGDIILVGETIYTGNTWYVDISPNTSFATSAGVITLVEADTNGTLYYKCSRGSNGTKPNWTSFRVTDNTDGIYIVSGTGTQSDKFVFAVHTKE